MLAVLLAEFGAAARSLLRQPRFTAVAALTLAIGVGAAAAGFGMVNQLLLRPIPGVRDPGGAAYVQFVPLDNPEDQTGISLPDFLELRRSASLVQGMASYGNVSLHVRVGDGRPVEVRGNLIIGDFFELVGVRPAAGRLLSAGDTELDADPMVAVISERLWESLFGRAPDVVGKSFIASGKAVTVVGVAGGGFEGPERGDGKDLWLPWTTMYVLADLPAERLLSRGLVSHGDLLLRPRPGIPPQTVQSQISEILARIARSEPESAEHLSGIRAEVIAGLHAPPLFRSNTYRSLAIVGGVVGLTLLIACANVANLLLFRALSRRGDVATRRAMGASSAALTRQHLVESFVLGALGSILGLGVGWLIGLPFRGMSLLRTQPFEGLAFDARVFLFAAAAALVTAILFGAVPAALAGRFDLGGALRESGKRETGRWGGLRTLVAALQVALSIALLVGASLLIRTLGNLYSADSGLDIDRVASLTVDLGDIPDEEQDGVHRALLAAAAAVPGVEAAALDIYGPFSAATGGRIRLPEAPEAERVLAEMTLVTPGWFELFGVQPRSGRTFRPEDWRPGAAPVVVLTAGLARTLFGDADAVGRTVVAGFGSPVEAEVVGVIEDLRLGGPRSEARPTFFQPYAPFPISYVTVLARAQHLDAELLARLTAAVEAALPEVPVPAATPLTVRIDARLAENRLFARMIGLLAALSALLAAVGLYGVVAFTVAGRRRELGIRLALGADGRRLARLIGRYALNIVALGTLLGLGGAYALSRFLDRLLFGVTPADPTSYAASALLFAVVALVACWRPARAAMKVDPVAPLRGE